MEWLSLCSWASCQVLGSVAILLPGRSVRSVSTSRADSEREKHTRGSLVNGSCVFKDVSAAKAKKPSLARGRCGLISLISLGATSDSANGTGRDAEFETATLLRAMLLEKYTVENAGAFDAQMSQELDQGLRNRKYVYL
jgi:hypothetical protein